MSNKVSLEKINLLHGHLSSIRSISLLDTIVNENCSKHLIFTGGGRAQLKVWEITINIGDNDDFSTNNVSCKDLVSYMLHGPDKERNKIWIGKELMYNADPETRFMDVSVIKNSHEENCIFVFVACSDGYLRYEKEKICI